MVGLLTKRNLTGDVQASVNGQRWLYHPQCLQPVPKHLLHTDPGTAYCVCGVYHPKHMKWYKLYVSSLPSTGYTREC